MICWPLDLLVVVVLRVDENFFRLFERDVMPGEMLHIPLGVILQIPDDLLKKGHFVAARSGLPDVILVELYYNIDPSQCRRSRQ